MKILFVVTYINEQSSYSPFIISQAESLRKNGIELDYFALKGKNFIKYISGIFKLRKYLTKRNYDIIHAHYNYNGWTSSFQNNCPLIVSFLGSDLLNKRSFPDNIINILINRRILSRADYIICKTQEMKMKISGKNNVSVIPNGVNFNMFFPMDKRKARQSLQLEENKKYLLFIGNPDRTVKNFKLAEKIVNLFDNNTELLVIYNRLPQVVNLYYNAADALILTSFYEGGVNVIKEAMACNCPIISVNVGDVEEVIKNTEGCYITSYNPHEFAEKIKTIFSSDTRTHGREHIRKYESNIVANKVIDVYKNICK